MAGMTDLVYEVGAAGFWFRNRASRKLRLPRIVRTSKKIVGRDIDLKQYVHNFFAELRTKHTVSQNRLTA